MLLPRARGPISAAVIDHLTGRRVLDAPAVERVARLTASVTDPGSDDDLQLGLAVCHELHYRGFDDVPDEAEWELDGVRRVLERRYEQWLRETVKVPASTGEPIDAALSEMVAADAGPSVSAYLMRDGTLEQYREYVRLRSLFHLKEADPHTWVIPRLAGRPKAALIEIQVDEYGGGRVEQMHSTLYAGLMRALGLDDTYGAYWPDADASMFASVNLMTMFGLNRRLRGAAVGHLAAFEMTSSGPSRRLGGGLRRLGFGGDATAFYDVHVQADSVHEQLAAVDLCGSFVAAHPKLRGDVLFGAASCLAVDARMGGQLLAAWGAADARLTA